MKRITRSLIATVVAASLWGQSMAQDKPRAVESDGTVNVPAFRLPPSPYLSDAARAALPHTASDSSAMLDRLVQSGAVPKGRASLRKTQATMTSMIR